MHVCEYACVHTCVSMSVYIYACMCISVCVSMRQRETETEKRGKGPSELGLLTEEWVQFLQAHGHLLVTILLKQMSLSPPHQKP